MEIQRRKFWTILFLLSFARIFPSLSPIGFSFHNHSPTLLENSPIPFTPYAGEYFNSIEGWSIQIRGQRCPIRHLIRGISHR